jgi:molybdopterin synthase sulfur carrier subunit
MAVIVTVPSALRQYADGQARLNLAAATVAELLTQLAAAHPALGARILNEQGELRSFVNLYVGDEDIRFLDGAATALRDGETVSIVPAIAGGTARI